MLEICDRILIGGAMSATLLKAQGKEIGISKHEADKIDVAKALLEKYGDRIIVPVDFACLSEFSEPATIDSYVCEIPADHMTVDIGPRTVELFSEYITHAKTIIRNGPVGVYEWEATRKGSEAIARAIIANRAAFSLSGGGDCLTLINML